MAAVDGDGGAREQLRGDHLCEQQLREAQRGGGGLKGIVRRCQEGGARRGREGGLRQAGEEAGDAQAGEEGVQRGEAVLRVGGEGGGEEEPELSAALSCVRWGLEEREQGGRGNVKGRWWRWECEVLRAGLTGCRRQQHGGCGEQVAFS